MMPLQNRGVCIREHNIVLVLLINTTKKMPAEQQGPYRINNIEEDK